MILDKIENANLYKGMHTATCKALEYIQNTNFYDLAKGKHEFDGDTIFGMIYVD